MEAIKVELYMRALVRGAAPQKNLAIQYIAVKLEVSRCVWLLAVSHVALVKT